MLTRSIEDALGLGRWERENLEQFLGKEKLLEGQ